MLSRTRPRTHTNTRTHSFCYTLVRIHKSYLQKTRGVTAGGLLLLSAGTIEITSLSTLSSLPFTAAPTIISNNNNNNNDSLNLIRVFILRNIHLRSRVHISYVISATPSRASSKHTKWFDSASRLIMVNGKFDSSIFLRDKGDVNPVSYLMMVNRAVPTCVTAIVN